MPLGGCSGFVRGRQRRHQSPGGARHLPQVAAADDLPVLLVAAEEAGGRGGLRWVDRLPAGCRARAAPGPAPAIALALPAVSAATLSPVDGLAAGNPNASLAPVMTEIPAPPALAVASGR